MYRLAEVKRLLNESGLVNDPDPFGVRLTAVLRRYSFELWERMGIGHQFIDNEDRLLNAQHAIADVNLMLDELANDEDQKPLERQQIARFIWNIGADLALTTRHFKMTTEQE